MKVRPATKDDLDDIMSCVKRIKKEYFEAKGIRQWLGDYPSKSDFTADIEAKRLFVMHIGECLIGFSSVSFDEEPTYAVIEGEGWKKNDKYAVVHRFGINPDWQGMGFGTTLMGLADKLCEAHHVSDIRADTHEDNAGMRHLLEKCGFEYRGIIHLANGDPRMAFEKNM